MSRNVESKCKRKLNKKPRVRALLVFKRKLALNNASQEVVSILLFEKKKSLHYLILDLSSGGCGVLGFWAFGEDGSLAFEG